jgi:DHA3 family tetracycline resistance protein-like MFS transporter
VSAPPRARDRWRAVRPLAHRDFRILFGAVVLSISAAGMWAVVMVYAVIRIDEDRPAVRRRRRERDRPSRLRDPRRDRCRPPARRLILRAVKRRTCGRRLRRRGGPVRHPHDRAPHDRLARARRRGGLLSLLQRDPSRILPAEHLLPANGLEGAVRPALQAAGPAMAGLLLAALIPSQAAGAVLLAHAAALVLLLFCRPGPAAEADRRSRGVEPEHPSRPRRAVLFTVRTPWLLWTLLFATIWVLVTMGPEEVLLPFVTRERFGPDPRLFGFLLACFGAGGWWDRSWSRRCGCRDATLSAMTLVWVSTPCRSWSSASH